MRPIVVLLGLPLLIGSSSAFAQSPTGPVQTAPAGTGTATPGAPAEPAKPAPNPNANSGYSYSDKRTGGGGGGGTTKKARIQKHSGPVVNLPGFEQLGDGGSRLFV